MQPDVKTTALCNGNLFDQSQRGKKGLSTATNQMKFYKNEHIIVIGSFRFMQ